MSRIDALAYLGIGSNLAVPTRQVRRALRWVKHRYGITEVRCSRLVFNAPVGPPQPYYVNAVAAIRTFLGPVQLLDALQELERAANRQRTAHWGARTLDLDLLLYEDLILNHPRLKLPHPRMHERPFVLRPLVELSPNVRHPVLDQTASDLLRSVGQ